MDAVKKKIKKARLIFEGSGQTKKPMRRMPQPWFFDSVH
jgi:hypothetical protein